MQHESITALVNLALLSSAHTSITNGDAAESCTCTHTRYLDTHTHTPAVLINRLYYISATHFAAQSTLGKGKTGRILTPSSCSNTAVAVYQKKMPPMMKKAPDAY